MPGKLRSAGGGVVNDTLACLSDPVPRNHRPERLAEGRAGDAVDEEVGGVGHPYHELGCHAVDAVRQSVLLSSEISLASHFTLYRGPDGPRN